MSGVFQAGRQLIVHFPDYARGREVILLNLVYPIFMIGKYCFLQLVLMSLSVSFGCGRSPI